MTIDSIYLDRHLDFALHKHITNLLNLDGFGRLLVSAWTEGPSWNHFIPNMELEGSAAECIRACEAAMGYVGKQPCFFLIESSPHDHLIPVLEASGYSAVSSEIWMTVDLARVTDFSGVGGALGIWDGDLVMMER